MTLRKIVSGGQTGVDRAALDAALVLGFPCGGWCPAGRLDENGVIPAHYPLSELKKGGFKRRTLQNVEDSDGTLIIYFDELAGGTETTALHCIKRGKPYRLIDAREVPVDRAADLTLSFVRDRAVAVLNVAGPRASKNPEAYDYAYRVVTGLLQQFAARR